MVSFAFFEPESHTAYTFECKQVIPYFMYNRFPQDEPCGSKHL